ncbi:MAG: tripartite tricarboxylate transporter substrate binding protein [Pigmentiphaga sp.]|uniref:Bug family tripartite tricarboxylate transporter substrate binding protein n=1 Tax=Pigmentiphaga sp. TaxID=1977564 RepID=UPI0029A6D0EB|nr:tripartite tricarboxylate transporter substrate binding protein [Pigmentiphaga sp.]MDX3906819.1 tripartite tricarboxylate transporter substrate binding protein [Pigmentiphaga sp.]
MKTRIKITAGAVASALALGAAAANAAYPERPIRLVVPHGPGGVADTVSRIFADALAQELKQPVIVENKAGASTMIGADNVAKAAPDGYTLLMASVTTLSINPFLYPNITYDPKRDFTPVSMVAALPFYLMASPTLGVKNVKDLVALAKSRPGQLNYSSPGAGTSPHLVGALFASMTGIDAIHVPYKSTAAAEVDLNAGRVHFAFTGSGMAPIRSGRVVGLGVTSDERVASMPDLPTLQEQGLALDATVWNGVVVPAGTPPEVVNKLAAALAKIAKSPAIKEKVQSHGGIAVGNTPEEFERLIDTEAQRWEKVIKEASITVQ